MAKLEKELDVDDLRLKSTNYPKEYF